MEKESKQINPLNKVTTLSKVIAGTLFIALPVLLFWIGYNQGYSQGFANGTLVKQSDDIVSEQNDNTVNPTVPTVEPILNPLTEKYYYLEHIIEVSGNTTIVIGHKITEINPDGTSRLVYSNSDSRDYSARASMIDVDTIGLFNTHDNTAETIDLNTLEVKVLKKYALKEYEQIDYFTWIDKNSFVYVLKNFEKYDNQKTILKIFANGIDKELSTLNFFATQRGFYYGIDSLRFVLSPDKKSLIMTGDPTAEGSINQSIVFDLSGNEKFKIDKINSPEWLDNKTIAYTSTADSNLYKVNIETKEKTLLLNTSNNPVYGIRHRNGKIIYWRPSAEDVSNYYLFDLKSKTEKLLVSYAVEADWLNDNEIFFKKLRECYYSFEKCDQRSSTTSYIKKFNIVKNESEIITNKNNIDGIFSLNASNNDDITCDNSAFCLD